MLSTCYTTILFISSITSSAPSAVCPLPTDYALPTHTVNASQMNFFTEVDDALLRFEWAPASEKFNPGSELVSLMHISEEKVAEELFHALRHLQFNRLGLLFSSDRPTHAITRKKETIFDIIFLHKILGKAYIKHGYNAKALHLYGEALWLSQQTFGDKDRVSAPIYNKLGNYYGLRGDYQTSLFCYKNALNALQENDRYASELRARVYYNMAEVYRKTMRYKKAGSFYRKSGSVFAYYYGISDGKALRSYYMRYLVILVSSPTLTLMMLFFSSQLLLCTRHLLRSLYF